MQIHELNNFNGTPGATNFLAIDDGSDTSRISGEALLDPVNGRIDNLTANVLPDSVETILDWADVESASKTLTKNVSGFDYIDLYFKEVTSGTNRIVFAQRYPRTAFPAQVTIPVISWGGGTDPKYLYFQDLMIAISGTTLTMSQLRIYSWDGKAVDGANIETGVLVDQIRVDGIKISSNTSAELTDLRTAHNGTVYASARAAREADYNALNGEITDVKTDLVDFEGGDIHIPVSNFSRGSLKADGTINANQSYYASTNADITFNYPVKLSVKDGYKYILFTKTGESTYFNLGWTTADTFIPANTLFKVEIGRVTETWGASDLPLFSRQINIISKDRAEILFNKAQIEKLQNGNELLNASFERGALTNGVYSVYTQYRVATPNIVKYARPITIMAESGFRFGIHTFDDNDNFVADLGWKTILSLEANQGFKIVIARISENTSEKADVFDFYTKVSIQSTFKDYVNNKSNNLNVLEMPFMQSSKPKLVSHTGYHNTYPENTIPAYEEAGEKGYWSLESDVQQTSDGHFIMMHDPTVDRTTNGSGNVNEMTLTQIRALQIKNHPDLKVPTLEEYLSICKMYGMLPQLEIKETVTDIAGLIEVIKDYGMYHNIVLSGSKWTVDDVRAITEDIPYFGIFQSALYSDYDTEITYMKQFKNVGMCLQMADNLDHAIVKRCHDNNMAVCGFIGDTLSDVKDLFMLGCDMVTTNVIVLPTD